MASGPGSLGPGPYGHDCAGWRGRVVAFGMGFPEVVFERRERGHERTITTLHTETNHVFTAFAPHWIPTCWSRAWLATSWQDFHSSSSGLSLPRHIHYLFWSYSLSQVQRQSLKPVLMQQWVDTTHGWGGCNSHNRTWNLEKWFAEARRLLSG